MLGSTSKSNSRAARALRARTLGLIVACALILPGALWACALTLGYWLIYSAALIVSIFFVGSVAWVIRKIIRWKATLWLGAYLRTERSPLEPDCAIDLCFLFKDHFEPDWRDASVRLQLERVHKWELRYPQAISGHTDSDGRCPQHTWFCPVALTSPGAMTPISTWPGRHWGEIEYHLHHAPKMNEERIRTQIIEDLARLKEYGAISSGHYGFVHGMFALAAGDRRYCNAPNEIDVLLQTGCYADFTFPALGTPAQPRQVNSIYYARSNGRDKPYDRGKEATVGQSPDGLLIVPGPMCFGVWPRVLDNSEVGHYPPHPRRISRWLAAHVHVSGRPNWVFISVHCHTAQDDILNSLFAGPMQRLWSALERRFKTPSKRLHYVTAREAYNIIKAAEAGHDGNPNDYRDFEIPPPENRTERSACESRTPTEHVM